MTCVIKGLDVGETPTTVIWKDPEGNTVFDNEEYHITLGTVDSGGSQLAELTISSLKLKALAPSSPVTYKCSAQSALFPESPVSPDIDHVLTLLRFGRS